MLQEQFSEQYWIVAEIGELKVNRAGHCYLELIEKSKNSDEILARTRATIWSWQFRFIQPYFESATGRALAAGLKILTAATVEFHEVYGLSLNIKDIDPTYTLGDLAQKRQEIINRLTEEGIIDMNKELELPDIPSRIAIISSPTAAGYEDFMNQLYQNPAGYAFHTRLFEATMQGNNAALSIMNALDEIFGVHQSFDAVVIIRGGGSQMDLACFDHYELAQHIAQFPLPVLTGIGHEKDESIADLVAHTKLKTPTAVAEFLISCFDTIADEIEGSEMRLSAESMRQLEANTRRLDSAIRVLKPLVGKQIEKAHSTTELLRKSIKPLTKEFIEKERHRLSFQASTLLSKAPSLIAKQQSNIGGIQSKLSLFQRLWLQKHLHVLASFQVSLSHLTKKKLEKQKYRVDWSERSISLVDPQNILKRGYSITTHNGIALKDSSFVKPGDTILTRLSKGLVNATVSSTEQQKNDQE